MANHGNELLTGDIRILRADIGTKPGRAGTRYAYRVITPDPNPSGMEILLNTGYELKIGTVPNLHLLEQDGRVVLEAARVERDFVKV